MIPPSFVYATSCDQVMENLRARQLQRLFRMEEDYRRASWHYRKYQEIVYGPLWQAGLLTNDRFSTEKQTEGKIAFGHYRFLADGEQEKARESFRRMEKNLKKLEMGLSPNDACREAVTPEANSISDFRTFGEEHPVLPESTRAESAQWNCMEIFESETGESLKKLRKLLLAYYKEQEVFSERVENVLTDTKSDHDTFEDRFRDYLFASLAKSTSAFLALTLDLQERFEQKWPAAKCCEACLKDRTAGQDPVLNQIKLDSQGSIGVAGQLVNNASLEDAFDRLEKEEEGKRGKKREEEGQEN